MGNVRPVLLKRFDVASVHQLASICTNSTKILDLKIWLNNTATLFQLMHSYGEQFDVRMRLREIDKIQKIPDLKYAQDLTVSSFCAMYIDWQKLFEQENKLR